MSQILPIFPDDYGKDSTTGGSFREPIDDADAVTLKTLKDYFRKYRISLVGTSRVYIDVQKTFGHITVAISPTQAGQLIGRYRFQKNNSNRKPPIDGSSTPVDGNVLIVEWAGPILEICKMNEENDGIYDVSIIFE